MEDHYGGSLWRIWILETGTVVEFGQIVRTVCSVIVKRLCNWLLKVGEILEQIDTQSGVIIRDYSQLPERRARQRVGLKLSVEESVGGKFIFSLFSILLFEI